MYRGWIVATALLIAIYCLMIYIRRVIVCKKTEYGAISPGLSLLFLVKNQQDIVEGLIREVFADPFFRATEVVAIDCGSVDETRLILERLAGDFYNFKFVALSEEPGLLKKVYRLCRGETIFCFDLTGPINYNLMSRTIHAILHGSRASLYRTRILYKHDVPGCCKHSYNMLK